jgi:hypothetical protein
MVAAILEMSNTFLQHSQAIDRAGEDGLECCHFEHESLEKKDD